MTTAYQIIVDAYRQSNLIALGVAPTQAQETEALRYLNRILKSVFGNEVGEQLQGFPIGGNNIERPSGYPHWTGTPSGQWFVPKNTLANMNVTESVDLFLTPWPDDGTRFAVVDASRNLATFPATVHGNGAFIEGATEIVLNTDGFEGSWMYRADRAEWVKYDPLTLFDTFPFPEEFDDFFILNLAFRLNPAYERQLDPQSAEMLRKASQHIRARYTQHIPVQSELGLIRPAITAADRDRWTGPRRWISPNTMFNEGWFW